MEQNKDEKQAGNELERVVVVPHACGLRGCRVHATIAAVAPNTSLRIAAK